VTFTNLPSGEKSEELSDKIEKALDEALDTRRNGKSFPHQQTTFMTKYKFTNLF